MTPYVASAVTGGDAQITSAQAAVITSLAMLAGAGVAGALELSVFLCARR